MCNSVREYLNRHACAGSEGAGAAIGAQPSWSRGDSSPRAPQRLIVDWTLTKKAYVDYI